MVSVSRTKPEMKDHWGRLNPTVRKALLDYSVDENIKCIVPAGVYSLAVIRLEAMRSSLAFIQRQQIHAQKLQFASFAECSRHENDQLLADFAQGGSGLGCTRA